MRIVHFDCDTLRPDHLGCCGYNRLTSPNIDALAEGSVIFTNACCSDSPCLPSRASLFTGRFGIHNGVVSHMGRRTLLNTPPTAMHFPGLPKGSARPGLDPRWFGLPKLMRENGVRTVTVSSFAERHDAWWWLDGWGEVIIPSLKRGNEGGEEVNGRALQWLEQNGTDKSYFLHINY